MSLFRPSPVSPSARFSPLARIPHLVLPLAALLLAGAVTPLAARDSLSVATPVLASAGTLVNLTDPVSGRSIQVRLADHRSIMPPAGRVQAAPPRMAGHPSASCPITRSCGARAPAPVIEP